jgi:hypothetical protein
MKYSEIPPILTVGTFENPVPRGLKQFAEILHLMYKIFEHPLFLKNCKMGIIDPFRSDMESPEILKQFNRTVVERTIFQATQFSNIKVDDQYLTLSGQGIELAISDFREYWKAANLVLLKSEEEQQVELVNIHYLKITVAGAFEAHLKFILSSTQELITNVLKGSVVDQLKNKTDEQQYKFLIRWKADLMQKEDQFSEKSFRDLMNTINIELEVLEKCNYNLTASTEIINIVNSFLNERDAQISNHHLLQSLIAGDYDAFQNSLKELVMQLFSCHDITKDVPEKVYHSFLLGVFNSFSSHFELHSNKEAGLGRFDLLLIPHNRKHKGFIFEVKKSNISDLISMKKQANEALQQIREKSYYIELKSKGVTNSVSFAVVFHGKFLFIEYVVG